MSKLVLSFMVCLGLCGLANAFELQYSSPDGGLVVYLDTKTPCDKHISDLFNDDLKGLEWVGAEVTYQGRKLVACAAPSPMPGPDGGPAVVIVDEQGDGGVIPATKFHQVKAS